MHIAGTEAFDIMGCADPDKRKKPAWFKICCERKKPVMNYFHFLLAGTLILLSCNNSSENSTTPVDSSTEKVKEKARVNSDSLPITAAPADLTTAERGDDAVFADGSKPTSWKNAGIDDSIAFKNFLKHVQYWVAGDRRDSVASIIAFPLHHPKLKSKGEFLKSYNTLINDNVKKALVEINFRQLFRNVNGVMIGSGELWFGRKNHRFAIIAINE